MTTSERRALEVLDILLDVPPASRRTYLNIIGSHDRGLHREVASLLAADGERVAFLEQGLSPSPDHSAAPLSVGPFHIEREVGSGGMGSVYLAVRAGDECRREVAVKVLKPGMDHRVIIKRFHEERAILAQLDHPRIARLYEGGSTREGLPYFVMEYVEGLPIDQFCAVYDLSTKARMQLFQKVCLAVGYAHRNLVIHRDIKPANILVTADGEPKLLDFGIAKLLQDENPSAPHGEGWLTPEYASPEQLRGEPVNTAGDVYALGVLLYELLSGRRPYPFSSRSPTAMEREIQANEPEKPSAVLRRRRSGQSQNGRKQTLHRELTGDLDSIVLKALHKDPNRRYASADHLAEDLERFLNHFPVKARGGSPVYSVLKFLRRHRFGALVTTLAILLLLGLTASLAVQREKAQRERDRAAKLARSLVGIFDAGDQHDHQRETITARALLDRAATEMKDNRHDPGFQSAMSHALGAMYFHLGLFREARPLLENALAARKRLYGPHHLDTAASTYQLGVVRTAEGDYAAAEKLLTQALAVRKKRLGPQHGVTLEVIRGLAMLYGYQGRFDEADRLLQSMGDSENHTTLANALENRASQWANSARYDEAEALYHQSLNLKLRVFGEQHPSVAATWNNLGNLQLQKDTKQDALSSYQQALAIFEEAWGSDHPDVATVLHNLARVHKRLGNYLRAISLYQRVVAIRERAFGSAHATVTASRFDLARLHHHLGHHDQARREYEGLLQIPNGTHQQPIRVSVLERLANLHCGLGQHEKAAIYLNRALHERQRELGLDHPDHIATLSRLAFLHEASGQFERAETLLAKALAISEKTGQSGHALQEKMAWVVSRKSKGQGR